MRDRPFIPAGESPRPYSDVVAERRTFDPSARVFDAHMAEIERLEAAALDAKDPAEAKRLQCEAEGLRCDLSDNFTR